MKSICSPVILIEKRYSVYYKRICVLNELSKRCNISQMEYG